MKNANYDIIKSYRCTMYNQRCTIILDAVSHLIYRRGEHGRYDTIGNTHIVIIIKRFIGN